MTPRAPAAAGMSERALVDAVVQYARLRGYLVCHFRPALTADGQHVTPIQGDAGFPDLVICGRGRLWMVEAKSDVGTVDPEQKLWLSELSAAGVAVDVWRPRHWKPSDEILEVLG